MATDIVDHSDKLPLVDDEKSEHNEFINQSNLSVNPDIIDVQDATPSTAKTTPSKSLFTSNRFYGILCILFCELCERLTYYSISGNLVLFCTSVLDFPSDTAAVIALVFSGTAFFSPVFGGWVADSIAGKYNTIYGGLLIYVIGMLKFICTKTVTVTLLN